LHTQKQYRKKADKYSIHFRHLEGQIV
jgi:hypothetical protein